MIKLLNFQLAGAYTRTGNLVYNERLYIDEQTYRDMMFSIDDNYFVGLNEYCSSAVINRCVRKLYNIQLQIMSSMQTVKSNTYPNAPDDIAIEPYLHTAGSTYQDIDEIPYTGYYHIAELPAGDVVVTGRNTADGTARNGQATTDRYLSRIIPG